MPRFDGTGPWGEGPMTGGGFGSCNSATGKNRRTSGTGAGRRMGRGFGRPRGRNRVPDQFGASLDGMCRAPNDRPFSREARDEMYMLRNKARVAKKDLEAINRRLQELESESSESEL